MSSSETFGKTPPASLVLNVQAAIHCGVGRAACATRGDLVARHAANPREAGQEDLSVRLNADGGRLGVGDSGHENEFRDRQRDEKSGRAASPGTCSTRMASRHLDLFRAKGRQTPLADSCGSEAARKDDRTMPAILYPIVIIQDAGDGNEVRR